MLYGGNKRTKDAGGGRSVAQTLVVMATQRSALRSVRPRAHIQRTTSRRDGAPTTFSQHLTGHPLLQRCQPPAFREIQAPELAAPETETRLREPGPPHQRKLVAGLMGECGLSGRHACAAVGYIALGGTLHAPPRPGRRGDRGTDGACGVLPGAWILQVLERVAA